MPVRLGFTTKVGAKNIDDSPGTVTSVAFQNMSGKELHPGQTKNVALIF
ncbi:MAG: hypothetical protein KAJ60_09410 [Desulfobulbaceae bacterium]|nr:hypothetical protein [Desulfobulbaceae bacterium]